MDISLDTDITIHLYNAGKEELLFKYFDSLYIHEFILEHEIKNKSSDVYKRLKCEANAIALASALGIAALATDDTKEYGPHDTLLKECIEDVIPFAFYELLYLEYLESNDDFDRLKNEYEHINHIAYPERPMNFISRIKRVVRRFSSHGTNRDFVWMRSFCSARNIDYNRKMQLLFPHLKNVE